MKSCALTEDFAIDVVPDEKPTVQILRPGRDYQATNIEEVPVSLKAQDDFRLEALELHYSVNGGDWRVEKLDAGAADIQAAALLRLEEMQQKGRAWRSAAAGAGRPRQLLRAGARPQQQHADRPVPDPGAAFRAALHAVAGQWRRRWRRWWRRRPGPDLAAPARGAAGHLEPAAHRSRRRWPRRPNALADNARMLAEVQKTLAEQATHAGGARARRAS